MFIYSKRNFIVRLSDGSSYRIAKDCTGEIPGRVAETKLIKDAVSAGLIVTPSSHKDAEIADKIDEAKEVEETKDIRPDAKAKKSKK